MNQLESIMEDKNRILSILFWLLYKEYKEINHITRLLYENIFKKCN